MKGQANPQNLLWIDDDGSDRFPYESRKLSSVGYRIAWAASGIQAAESLRTEPYEVVLIDQQLPWDRGESVVWGGVLLYAWALGKNRPLNAPPCAGFDNLFLRQQRLDHSVKSRVLIVSAFYDTAVAEALKILGLEDRLVLSKPVDLDALLEILKETSDE